MTNVTLTSTQAQAQLDAMEKAVDEIQTAKSISPSAQVALNALGDAMRALVAACPTCTPPGNTPPPQS